MTLAIVNPTAGGGRCGKEAGVALARLCDAGVDAERVLTEAPGDATRFAREAYGAGERDFIAVGGDGTTYEILNGLFPEAALASAADRVSVGMLPLGTGNSFLRDFTEEGTDFAITALVEGRRRACDVLRARGPERTIYFLNLLSIGWTADVGRLVNDYLKGLGEAGYGVGVLYKVLTLCPKPIPFGLDGAAMHREPVTFLSFNNSRFTGGKMMMAPDADPCDGRLDAIIVGDLGRIGLLRTFPKIFAGTHTEDPRVSTATATEVAFELTDPVDVMVDGEVFPMVIEAIDILPGALDVRV